MRKNTVIALLLICCLALVSCAPTVPGQPTEKSSESVATQPQESQTETEAEETKVEETTLSDSATLPESEEETWKKEPAYGKTLYYYINGGCSSGPAVAEALGLYEKAGLKVEGLKTDGAIVEAVGTGKVQIAIEHIATSLVPGTNGVDLTFTGGAHIGCKSLYVLGSSDYHSTADLKGKTVSVPDGIGNSDYNIASRFFDADGINPMKDVKLMQVEKGACIPAMEREEIAGVILSDMYAYDMVKDGTLRRIRSLNDEDFSKEACCVILMNKTFIKENPITAKKLNDCVKMAHTWMRENNQENAQLQVEKGWSSGSVEKVADFLSNLNFGLTDEFTSKTLKKIVDDYIRLGFITQMDDTQKVMDTIWTSLGEPEAEAEVKGETAENNSSESDDKTMGSLSAEEEEAWKKEPAYGKPIHYWLSDSCTSGPHVADKKGFFEKQGLKAEGVKGSSYTEALGTAAVDVAVGHIATMLVPCTNGVDLTFVAGAHVACKSLYVLADSDYKTTEDLKGTKVSVPNGIGASDYNITARLIHADGINPLKDLELVQVETSACVNAMKNKEISAALLSDIYAYDMVKDGTLRRIRSLLDEDFVKEPCCVVAMNASFVKENPVTSRKVAKAIQEAHQWMRLNSKEATQFLLDEGLNSGDLEKNKEINESLQFGVPEKVTGEALKHIVEEYIELGLITSSDDVEAIFQKAWTPLDADPEVPDCCG